MSASLRRLRAEERLAYRSDKLDSPSLWHTMPFAVSERFRELLDSHQSPRSDHFLHCP
jgi:hypothetical protein